MGSLKTKAQNILTEKNTKLIPENIKAGVTIFNITGTHEGGGKLNIYVQNSEPNSKNGIWFKGNYNYSKVISSDNTYATGEWNTDRMATIKEIPYNMSYRNNVVVVGDAIYLISVYSGYLLKYDSKTDTYTTVFSGFPLGISYASLAVVGTDIWFMGCNNLAYQVFKYDTITNSCTVMSNTTPWNMIGSCAISYGGNVYIFGGYYYDNYRYYAYRYNVSTDTYTQLTNIPFPFDRGSAAIIGTDIYLFGSNQTNYGNKAYKYDILQDKWTELTNIPYDFYNGIAVASGTNIYLYGGSTSFQVAYKYDTLTDTYTEMDDLPYSCYNGSGVLFDTDIFIFGGSNYPKKVQVMTMFNSSEFPDKSIVLLQDNIDKYRTVLSETNVKNGLLTTFSDAFYYTTADGFDRTIATAYGTGTEWVFFRNIPVKGVTINKNSEFMLINDTLILTASVIPANAKNKNIIWTTSDSSVASINGGTVTALSIGNAIITATTEDGSFSATCDISVSENYKDVYNELTYIQANGAQYINTLVVPKNHKIEIKFDFETYNNDEHLFGTSSGPLYYHFTAYSNAYYYGLDGSETHAGTWTTGIHTLKYNDDDNAVILDDVKLSSGSKITSSSNLLLCRRDSTTNFYGKIYYCKIWDKDNNTLVRDLIPVKRKNDNVIGLFDKQNYVFYNNSGSGEFIAGDVIEE